MVMMMTVMVVVMVVGRAEEPMLDRVHHDGPPVMRWEVTEGEGPLRAWKSGRNPYAPSCRGRKERRRDYFGIPRPDNGMEEGDGSRRQRRSVLRDWRVGMVRDRCCKHVKTTGDKASAKAMKRGQRSGGRVTPGFRVVSGSDPNRSEGGTRDDREEGKVRNGETERGVGSRRG